MYRYIFGIDKNDPIGCARMLKSKGISAVVTDASGAHLAPVLKEEGLDTYLCFGAYGIGGEAEKSRLCLDASGESRVWFSSGCPNDRLLANTNLSKILETGQDSISGIFVDGARFASFASVEGPEAFFTCFCPECTEEMTMLGMDAAAIRASVKSLCEKRMLPEDTYFLSEWLHFREVCIKRYMDEFTMRIHSLDCGIAAGAFVFEPYLSPFVGQTPAACASLDIVAPMLYRNYPHIDGPACMGHEWAALYRMFEDNTSAFINLTGLSPDALPLRSVQQLMNGGFEPSQVGNRVIAALSGLHSGQKLWPIIQLEDDLLAETDCAAFENGADAVGYFAYGQATIPDML